MSAGEDRVAKPTGSKASNPDKPSDTAQDVKAQRLAEALRANLRRRKAQQRDRADGGKAGNDRD